MHLKVYIILYLYKSFFFYLKYILCFKFILNRVQIFLRMSSKSIRNVSNTILAVIDRYTKY